MHRLKESLKILELDGIPDLDSLQRSFKRLIKQAHPDLNLDRGEWANDRSRRLIQAFQTIRTAILSGAVSQTIDANSFSNSAREAASSSASQASPFRGGWPPERGGASTADGRAEPQVRQPSYFQLIQWENRGYALPVANIVRVVSFADPLIKKGLFGHHYSYDNGIYPIVSIDERDIPKVAMGFVILFRMDAIGLGLYIHDDMKFLEVKAFRENELVMHREGSSSKNGWVMHNDIPFLYPESHIKSAINKFVPDRNSARATKSG
jgi:hypothetical protein